MSTDTLEANTADAALAVEFLQELDPKGRHMIVAIVPDGPTEARNFAAGEWEAMRSYVDRHLGHRNLYFTANEPKPEAADKSPGDNDIANVRAVFVDIDAREGEPLDQATRAGREKLEALDVPPTFIVETGGGVQGLWVLGNKIPAERRLYFDNIQQALIEQLGGDAGVKSLKQLLRLPHTVNLPTRSKLRKHADRGPRPATVLKGGPRHDLGRLKTRFAPTVAPRQRRKQARATYPWELVKEAMSFVRNDDEWQTHYDVVMAMRAACGEEHDADAWAIIHEWAGESYKYDPEETQYIWDYAADVHSYSARTIFHLAEQGGWDRPAWTKQAQAVDEFEPIDIRPAGGYFLDYEGMIELPEPEWLVEGIIQRKTAALMFGKSNTFKSFLAIDIALAVATGRHWHGNAVKGPARVAYVATEGAIGVGKQRVPGWYDFHELEKWRRRNLYLRRLPVAIDEPGAVGKMLEAIDEVGGFELIVLDIFGGTMNGSEVEDTTARAWVHGVQRLIAKGSAVLTVAHTGWQDQTRARMHTHFWGSFDTRLKIEGDKDARTSVLSIERHKDADSLGIYPFRMEAECGTLVPVLDQSALPSKAEKLNATQRTALAMLEEALEREGEYRSGAGLPECKVVSEDAWRAACKGKLSASDKPNAHRMAFSRAKASLEAGGHIREHGGHVWPIADE